MDILLADEYEIAALKQMARRWLGDNMSLLTGVLSYPEEIYKGKRDYEILMAGERICRYIEQLG